MKRPRFVSPFCCRFSRHATDWPLLMAVREMENYLDVPIKNV